MRKIYCTMIVLASVMTTLTYAEKPAIEIQAVNYPLAYFAQKIGGETVNAHFILPHDEDPAYVEPDLETILQFQKADLILLNGANYAKWIAKVSLPRSKMVNTTRHLKDKYIFTDQVVTHSHGSAGEHAHENLAFTTWLDIQMAIEQARTIKDALKKKRPEKAVIFEKNFAGLTAQMTDLDNKLKSLSAQKPGSPLLVSHPVYDYMARAYKLNIKSLHWEPDQALSQSDFHDLKHLLADHPTKWMIWEGRPKRSSVKQLEALGLSSIVFFSCSTPPETGDFFTQMQMNIQALKPVFEQL